MALNNDEFNMVVEVLEEFESDPSQFNDWEKTFLTSMKPRMEKYKQNTFMSDKQLASITKMYEKIMGVPQDTESRFYGRR